MLFIINNSSPARYILINLPTIHFAPSAKCRLFHCDRFERFETRKTLSRRSFCERVSQSVEDRKIITLHTNLFISPNHESREHLYLALPRAILYQRFTINCRRGVARRHGAVLRLKSSPHSKSELHPRLANHERIANRSEHKRITNRATTMCKSVHRKISFYC